MKTRFFAFALLCSLLFACKGVDPENPNPGPEDEPQVWTDINGTAISESNNAIGLVTDAKTGKGIAGIPVTDGYTYTVTDANGVYQMAANRYCRVVYLSVPNNYKIPLDPATNLPLFYSTKKFDKSRMNRNDFTLEPQEVEDKFTMVMIGDPQCKSKDQAERYSSETVKDMLSTLSSLSATYPHPYGMTLGDVTFDSTDMWETMKGTMSNLKLADGSCFPIFQCIGNHDHNSLAQSGDYEATGKFVETFGPTDYSFDRGQVHIITMDDIMVTKVNSNSSPNRYTWSYNGGFTKAQYTWLEKDIAMVKNPETKIVFLCMHIPMRSGASSGGSTFNTDAYYSQTLALLKKFKEAHIMIGHTHYPQNYIHSNQICKGGSPIYEHIHGAACGAWWTTGSGLKSNVNVSGAPNGYSLYQIDGNTVTNWVAKGTNRNINHQIRVYDGNQIYSGNDLQFCWYTSSKGGQTYNVTYQSGSTTNKATPNANTQNAFVAEVWDDDATNWKLEFWQNGAKVGDFKRLSDGSCSNICCAAYFYIECAKGSSDNYYSKTASHYWYYKPASGNPASEKNWEVRASQTIPGSKEKNEYACGTLTTDYSDYRLN